MKRPLKIPSQTDIKEQQKAVSVAAGSVGQTPVPEQAKPRPKTVALKSGKLPQIFRRLSAIGFNRASDGRYVNSNPDLNIQEIAWEPDRIVDNYVWLFVTARRPFAYAAAAMERLRQLRQARVELKLRMAKEYWLKTIQPYIAGRKLRGVELFVAEDAWYSLRTAQQDTADYKVSVDALVDFTQEKFWQPEELCRDENLKPETLAAIAAPLMLKPKAKPTPFAAIGVAHELLMAAERYLKSLPEQRTGTSRGYHDLGLALSPVPFADIKASNQTNSGKLPLLPGVHEKSRELSLPAFRAAIKRFFEEKTKKPSQITEDEWIREGARNPAPEKEGGLVQHGSGHRLPYQEYLRQPAEALKDALQDNWIALQSLCDLRRQRFIRNWQKQSRAGSQKRRKTQNSRKSN